MSLPYIEPDYDIHLNLSTVLLIISALGYSKQGTLKINNERLHVFLYLIKNPTKLNTFLKSFDKKGVNLSEVNTLSVSSISSNVDSLFDRPALKSLISILIKKKLIEIEYKIKDGFFYKPTKKGNDVVERINGDYFIEIKKHCEKLKNVLSFSESKINKAVNAIIRKGSN